MEAHLAQIERVNPQVNAIVTLDAEGALERAAAADRALAGGAVAGPLFGLPIAHKDLVETRGMRTTYGSPLFREHVPEADALIVERLRAAGAIAIAKTNTPEFGAGSQTYNEVFGETRNPYDLGKTCGGSSGGAAVALACGMLPIADGSDLGGSLRNPASFCNVVGFRPSLGRVPRFPQVGALAIFSVLGPMARTVGDAALLLSAMAGPDARDPFSLDAPGAPFAGPLERELRGVRVAFSRDLGGLPLDPRVARVLEGARPAFEGLGLDVEDAEPDLRDADLCFKAWRGWAMELGLGALYDRAPELLKDTLRWNIEQGRALSAPALGEAERLRTALYHRMRLFMERYEFLILPVSQVPPFDLGERWVREIDGTKLETYLDWMRSCSFITVTGHPAISVPAGFTDDGLPVGVQIVGRHRDDLGVLQVAYAFERATRVGLRRPPLAS
jgi:amidase